MRAYAASLKISLNETMIYPVQFVSGVVGHLLSIGINVLFFFVIYLGGTPDIGGWTMPHIALLLATNNIVQWIDAFFFGSNIGAIPRLVRTGGLDHFLIKPLNTRFLLSTRKANLTAIVTLIAQLPLFIYAISALQLRPGVVQIAVYLLLIMAGAVIRHSLSFSAAAISFRWLDSSGVQMLVSEMLNLAGYPATIFRGGLRIFLMYVFPVLIVANVPAQALQGLIAPAGVAIAVGISLLFFIGSEVVWRSMLRYYMGASA